MIDEIELKKLWQTTNEKLEESYVINNKNIAEIKRLKVYSIIGSMKPIKIFTILIGMLWVGVGGVALVGIYSMAFEHASKFFLFSATVQILLTAIALVIYIYQLIKIYEVEIYDPIIKTQNKLAQLKVSTLWAARIMFLQLPIWTTFWWSESMLTDWSLWQWVFTLVFTVSFSIIALWLFFNIKYENRNKNWFKLIFNGKEWTSLMNSMDLLDEIKEFKKE